MNILRHGKYKSTTKIFRCMECGCEFEADKTEYESIFQTIHEKKELVFQSRCPECLLWTQFWNHKKEPPLSERPVP